MKLWPSKPRKRTCRIATFWSRCWRVRPTSGKSGTSKCARNWRAPDLKRLEQFDFKFPASIDEKKIRELASLRFLERHENAVFLGPPGVGKTHLAVSLGMEAIRHGFSVYFVSLPDLLDRLVQAQAEN